MPVTLGTTMQLNPMPKSPAVVPCALWQSTSWPSSLVSLYLPSFSLSDLDLLALRRRLIGEVCSQLTVF